MIERIRNRQKEFSLNKSDENKKVLGQYFTDSPIADFMSSMVDLKTLNRKSVKLLDCGAGYGMLTASTAIYLLDNGFEKVEAILYEIDNSIINDLRCVLEEVKLLFVNKNKIFNYSIFNDDFITSRPDLNGDLKFDVAVINPPYFKYSAKDSKYSKKTSDLFKGDPNIYASFIAVALSAMSVNGQLVAISPRSFLNGLYFKGFRQFILKHSRLDRIHVFKSRKDVFVDSNILQENIIFKLIKNKSDFSKIMISSSRNILDLNDPYIKLYSKNIIIDNSNTEGMIRIPETEKDYEVLLRAEKLESTFSKEGYFISTGRVVEHRAKDFITLEHFKNNQVPLIKAHNVSINGVVWDGKNKKDISFDLNDSFEKHLIVNKKYLILKRFTSKDEHRRLVAGIYSPVDGLEYIGVTNKLNYIRRKDSLLSEEEARGLSIIFNSEFMDDYYRCISGSTQVNATDVRVMKFPVREKVIELGMRSAGLDTLDYKIIEQILSENE